MEREGGITPAMTPSFKKRVQCIQSAFLICAIAIAVGLVWTTLGNPESREAARLETLQRTYIRGTITDRDGTPLSWSTKANGYRSYIDGETKQRAFSTVVGYYSPAYGTFGLEKTFNSQLIFSKCKSDGKQIGNTIQTTLDTNLPDCDIFCHFRHCKRRSGCAGCKDR